MFEEIMVEIENKSVSVLREKPRPSVESEPRFPCFVVGLSSHYHDKFSEQISSFYELVFLDLYWTSPNTFSEEDISKLTMDKMVAHIEQVRAELERQLGHKYAKIFILGHSAYGFITIEYALQHKDKLYGVINIASPFTFDREKMNQWEKEYMDDNFGSKKAGGPTPRWDTYSHHKNIVDENKEGNAKERFVRNYLRSAPAFFHNPKLWKNQDDATTKMWEPWKIRIINRITTEVRLEQRDVNMSMLSQYLILVTNMNCYEKASAVEVPVLWVMPLEDGRVNLYQLEDEKGEHKKGEAKVAERNEKGVFLKNVDIFYPAEGGHWPMYQVDSNTQQFDNKTIEWGKNVAIKAASLETSVIAKL
jgi:pimeloyl-ACP methyl ester carboxylesterase